MIIEPRGLCCDDRVVRLVLFYRHLILIVTYWFRVDFFWCRIIFYDRNGERDEIVGD